MEYRYIPERVCSSEIIVELDGETIKRVKIIDGCSGNSSGIAVLIEGMNVYEAIKKLKGIDCDGRGTSCPDQLAIAIKKVIGGV